MAARHRRQRSFAQPDRDMLGRADLLPDADRILKARVTAIEVTQRLRLRAAPPWAPPSSKWPPAMPHASPRFDGQFYLSGLDPSAAERLPPHRAAGGAGRHVRGHAARRRVNRRGTRHRPGMASAEARRLTTRKAHALDRADSSPFPRTAPRTTGSAIRAISPGEPFERQHPALPGVEISGWCRPPCSRRLTGTVVRLKLTRYGKDFLS